MWGAKSGDSLFVPPWITVKCERRASYENSNSPLFTKRAMILLRYKKEMNLMPTQEFNDTMKLVCCEEKTNHPSCEALRKAICDMLADMQAELKK